MPKFTHISLDAFRRPQDDHVVTTSRDRKPPSPVLISWNRAIIRLRPRHRGAAHINSIDRLPEQIRRGIVFEATESLEWANGDYVTSSHQHFVRSTERKNGRIDILLKERDDSFSIVEVKATDWEKMADHRVRPNVLRHCRQVMKYVHPFWGMGIDVCPGLVYPRAPLGARRDEIQVILEERCIQVVWADERVNKPPAG